MISGTCFKIMLIDVILRQPDRGDESWCWVSQNGGPMGSLLMGVLQQEDGQEAVQETTGGKIIGTGVFRKMQTQPSTCGL